MTKANKKEMANVAAPAGGMYFLGFLGSAVHFIEMSDGIWEIAVALLKAAVWPAFLINKVFDLLRI